MSAAAEQKSNPLVNEDFGYGPVPIQGDGDVFIGYPDDDPRAPYLLDGFGKEQRLADVIGTPWLGERKGYAYFPRNSWTGKSLGPIIWCADGADQKGYTVERIRKDQDGVWVGYDEKLGDPEKQVWGWINPEIGGGPSSGAGGVGLFDRNVLKAEDTKDVLEKPDFVVGENSLPSAGSAVSSSAAGGGSSSSSYQRPGLVRRIPTTAACSCCKERRPWCSAKLVTCSLCKQTACKDCRRFGPLLAAPDVRECEICQIRICDLCNRPPAGQEQRNPIRFCDICDKAFCQECIPIARCPICTCTICESCEEKLCAKPGPCSDQRLERCIACFDFAACRGCWGATAGRSCGNCGVRLCRGCLSDAAHAQTGRAPGICRNSHCKMPLCAGCFQQCTDYCRSCAPSDPRPRPRAASQEKAVSPAPDLRQQESHPAPALLNQNAPEPLPDWIRRSDGATSPARRPPRSPKSPAAVAVRTPPSQQRRDSRADSRNRRPSSPFIRPPRGLPLSRSPPARRGRSPPARQPVVRARSSRRGENAVEWVEVKKIQFSQDSIAERFRDGRPLSQLIGELRSGATLVEDVEVITVYRTRAGNLMTHDNRRVHCYKVAKIARCPAIITAEHVPEKKYTRHPKQRGVSVRRGKSSKRGEPGFGPRGKSTGFGPRGKSTKRGGDGGA